MTVQTGSLMGLLWFRLQKGKHKTDLIQGGIIMGRQKVRERVWAQTWGQGREGLFLGAREVRVQGVEGKLRKEQSLILEGFMWEKSFHISKLNQIGMGKVKLNCGNTWDPTLPLSSPNWKLLTLLMEGSFEGRKRMFWLLVTADKCSVIVMISSQF